MLKNNLHHFGDSPMRPFATVIYYRERLKKRLFVNLQKSNKNLI